MQPTSISFFSATILTLLALFPNRTRAEEQITICTGESAQVNVFDVIQKSFEESQKIKLIYVVDPKKGGALQTFKAFSEKKCEVAVSSGDSNVLFGIISDYKIPLDKASITYRVIGRDHLKFVVNKKIQVKKLSRLELTDLLSGKIQNWKEIAGPDQKIKLIFATEKASTNKVIKDLVLKAAPYSTNSENTDTWDNLIKKIEANPSLLGFLGSNTPTTNLNVLALEEEVGRPITMLTMGKPSENVLKLIRFISENGPR